MINDIMIYLVKVSMGSAILFLCYYLFFRRDTFYERNRLILIFTIVMPLVIPLINFSNIASSTTETHAQFSAAQTMVATSYYVETGISNTIQRVNYVNSLFVIYLTGLILSLLKIVTGLFTVNRIISRGEKIDTASAPIIVTDLNFPPLSFFRTIIIPRKIYLKGEYDSIINHERAHVEHRHYMDLLLSELFLSFQWFNPVAWMIRKSVKETHEFLADKEAANRSGCSKSYQISLVKLSNGGRIIPLAHNFNKRIIKKRISMMNRSKTRKIARIKNIMIVPATILLLATITAGSYAIIRQAERSPFTEISEQGIRDHIKFIASFPLEAAMANYQDIVYVQMKVLKNEIEELHVFNTPEKVTAPILDDIIIIALEADEDVISKEKSDEQYREILNEEGIRLAKKVSKLDVAEWKDKSVEVAIKFDFRLTPNVASVDPLKANGSNNMSSFDIRAVREGRMPLYIINGKVVSLQEQRRYFGRENSFYMQTSFSNGIEIFGEKAADGYSIIITKDEAIELTLGDYISQKVKSNEYPIFFNRGNIVNSQDLEQLDKDQTTIIFTMDGKDAVDLFGEKGKNGAAIIGRPVPKKIN